MDQDSDRQTDGRRAACPGAGQNGARRTQGPAAACAGWRGAGLAVNLATLGPIGFLPRMPGTWGSLAAMLLVAPFLALPLPWRVALAACLFVVGGLAATRAEAHFGRCDPGMVVIDEVLGVLVTFLPMAWAGLPELAAGFILFRVVDILKPWPICWSEKCLPKGFGIMIDDVLAGTVACAVLQALVAIGGA